MRIRIRIGCACNPLRLHYRHRSKRLKKI